MINMIIANIIALIIFTYLYNTFDIIKLVNTIIQPFKKKQSHKVKKIISKKKKKIISKKKKMNFGRVIFNGTFKI
jgi:hypothetical protein